MAFPSIYRLTKISNVGSMQNRLYSLSNKLNSYKTGILMLTMGGPQLIEETNDYLLRIMTDTDIIQLPFQKFLGPLIAKRRTPELQKKYKEIGGGCSLFKWTNIQGELMCKKLDKLSPETAPHKHYIAFRYAKPLTETALQQIQEDGVKRVVIFSQYPQYSCATSGSNFNEIYSCYMRNLFPSGIKWSIIDRWATHPFLIKTFADRIAEELKKFPQNVRSDVIILFSAHSLPLKAVNRGDSYPSEVGYTVNGVMEELSYCNPYHLVWQSKVGPVPWLGPFTDEAIRDYSKKGKKNFLLVPIAFINEHIETLHELDIEYCDDLAKEVKVDVRRTPSPNDHPLFINGLADIVAGHLRSKKTVSPKFLLRCPHCTNVKCHDAKQWYQKLCFSS